MNSAKTDYIIKKIKEYADMKDVGVHSPDSWACQEWSRQFVLSKISDWEEEHYRVIREEFQECQLEAAKLIRSEFFGPESEPTPPDRIHVVDLNPLPGQ